MSTSLHEIRDALLAKLSGISGIGHVSQRWRPLPSAYPAYPALVLHFDHLESEDSRAGLRMRQRYAWWRIYIAVKDPTDAPDQIFEVGEAICAAVETGQDLGIGKEKFADHGGRAIAFETLDPDNTVPEVTRGYQSAIAYVRTSYLAIEGEI